MDLNNMKIEDYLNILFELTPEFREVFVQRHKILKVINSIGPIGRRMLSNKINISERIIRKETDILKQNKLLETTFKGMIITGGGKKVLEILDQLYYELNNMSKTEEKLAKLLGIKKVIITSTGIIDEKITLNSIGEVAAQYLLDIISKDKIIGITGGTTVGGVIKALKVKNKKFKDTTIVPARGSLGIKSNYQANTLVEMLANKLGAKYKLLFTPDKLSQETIKRLQNEPEIKETLSLINNIDTLLFGVGKADTMTKRRGLGSEEIKMIEKKGAVAEAFGYYFNSKGEIVHEINTIGINLNKIKQIKNLIAVSGGIAKVESILAITKLDSKLVLITDDSVANEILRRFEEEKEWLK